MLKDTFINKTINMFSKKKMSKCPHPLPSNCPPPAAPVHFECFHSILRFWFINISINMYAYLCILSSIAAYPCICFYHILNLCCCTGQ